MANLTNITQFKAEYSENILPIMEGRTLTITSGMANGAVNYNNNFHFDEGSSIKMDITSSGLNKFINFNLSDYSVTAPKTANYIFSYRLKKVNPTDSIDFTVEIFVNGILSTDTTYDNNLAVNGNWTNLHWNTFAQSISLNAGDVLTFRFIMNTDLLITSLYLDALKLELDDRFLGIPSIYRKPKDYDISNDKLLISETQWDVADIGPQVVSNGAYLNLLTLINNAVDKNTANTDSFDELNIVSNSIVTTYRECKTIHLIRISLNITAGTDQHYQLQIRRTVDDSVVYRALMQRNADETIQTIEMTTRTLSDIDPFVVDGFYLAFVNNSGASATIDDTLSLVIISSYQKAQKV